MKAEYTDGVRTEGHKASSRRITHLIRRRETAERVLERRSAGVSTSPHPNTDTVSAL